MKYLLLISQAWLLFFLPPQTPAQPAPAAVPPVSVETSLEANEMGRIPILEYHSIGPTEYRWTRSAENFRKDLEWLYNNDYVLLSIEDYAHDRYPIPAGKKPVVLTFDDGKPNQFRYLENGEIDPDCAVGILDRFHEEHPDFGTAAVFYLNRYPFGSVAEAPQKLAYLYQTGRQIGYHTLDHNDLRYLGAGGTLAVLNEQKKMLEKWMPEGMPLSTLAYPHGWGPAGDRQELSAMISVGLLIGAEPAYPLYHEKADPYRTPRIQAIDDEWLRHFGRPAGTIEKQDHPEKFDVFVSDGITDEI
ncbi:polysaccharide deacetylase family protein [Candidatus Peregrinibacteria bacterium]|nr:polysaccharide deacetylase family protein [Candidatus Peregrinibacteria bacterium]